jgi:hypothetical protein
MERRGETKGEEREKLTTVTYLIQRHTNEEQKRKQVRV